MVALFAATNDADINDVHGKGGSHGGQTRKQGPPGSSDMSFGGIKWHHNLTCIYLCHVRPDVCSLAHTAYIGDGTRLRRWA